jgi:hypothetical protein
MPSTSTRTAIHPIPSIPQPQPSLPFIIGIHPRSSLWAYVEVLNRAAVPRKMTTGGKFDLLGIS